MGHYNSTYCIKILLIKQRDLINVNNLIVSFRHADNPDPRAILHHPCWYVVSWLVQSFGHCWEGTAKAPRLFTLSVFQPPKALNSIYKYTEISNLGILERENKIDLALEHLQSDAVDRWLYVYTNTHTHAHTPAQMPICFL